MIPDRLLRFRGPIHAGRYHDITAVALAAFRLRASKRRKGNW
jgi:hypothetical protein